MTLDQVDRQDLQDHLGNYLFFRQNFSSNVTAQPVARNVNPLTWRNSKIVTNALSRKNFDLFQKHNLIDIRLTLTVVANRMTGQRKI